MDEPGARHLEVLRRERRTDEERDVFEGEIHVPEDLVYFRGHFEGDPILPGVVQLDGAVLPLVEEAWPELAGALRRVMRLKFIAPIRPGDGILVRLERRGDLRRVIFRIDLGETTATRGILSFEKESSA